MDCLEAIRLEWGKPIVITSGYRCPELNKAVNGSKMSHHLVGQAADIKWDLDLFTYLAQYADFDQLIREQSGQTKWIHISFRKSGNRHQIINIKK